MGQAGIGLSSTTATLEQRYRTALLDWLACAVAGSGEPGPRAAAVAAEGSLGRIAALAAAGHALDFDDTYSSGLAHLSAPVAPVALVLAADNGQSLSSAIDAYVKGFEGMAAMARASHPELYRRGFHPTSVCGAVGAAIAAAAIFELDDDALERALALALLRASGMQAGFGSDAKALGVGWAAAAGVDSARVAAAGARAELETAMIGFHEVTGGDFARVKRGDEPAVMSNWIKAYPCCLQAHGAIEAALKALDAGVSDPSRVVVRVHPVSRRAASYDDVSDGLQAKFSIPYLTAYTLLQGAPDVDSFRTVDDAVRQFAKQRISIRTDAEMYESETAIVAGQADGDDWVGWVTAPLGSPERPMDAATLEAKVERLAGGRLAGALDDPATPAAEVLELIGFGD